MLQQSIPLEFLRAGEEGRICGIDGDQQFVVRLEEMGLSLGMQVAEAREPAPVAAAPIEE